MRTTYHKNTEKSGVRLLLLLENHLREILKREEENRTLIHLYCTEPYWVAFEKSAYLLRQVFPDSKVIPMRLIMYPFPIVLVSVTEEVLFRNRRHLFLRENDDYGRLCVPSRSLAGYRKWHEKEMEGLTQYL